jgi:NADH:ubiquinone oxidoreductase subunit 2 (subunit N)
MVILDNVRRIEAIAKHYTEYLLIYTLSIILLFVLVSVRDLFGVFMCLEGLSLGVIGLLSMNYQSQESLKGAGACYVLAGICTFCFFVALTLIYGSAHTLMMVPLSYCISYASLEFIVHSPTFYLAVVFLALAFLYKLGAYTLHL